MRKCVQLVCLFTLIGLIAQCHAPKPDARLRDDAALAPAPEPGNAFETQTNQALPAVEQQRAIEQTFEAEAVAKPPVPGLAVHEPDGARAVQALAEEVAEPDPVLVPEPDKLTRLQTAEFMAERDRMAAMERSLGVKVEYVEQAKPYVPSLSARERLGLTHQEQVELSKRLVAFSRELEAFRAQLKQNPSSNSLPEVDGSPVRDYILQLQRRGRPIR